MSKTRYRSKVFTRATNKTGFYKLYDRRCTTIRTTTTTTTNTDNEIDRHDIINNLRSKLKEIKELYNGKTEENDHWIFTVWEIKKRLTQKLLPLEKIKEIYKLMNVDIDIKKIRKQIATCNRRLKRKVKEEIVKLTTLFTNDE